MHSVHISHLWLKSRLCVFISIHGHRHAHLFLSVLFLVSLYFVLKSFFHLFLNPAMVPDENSMEDPLCNSSFGSMVSLDNVTPDTGYEPKDMELADTNERNLATSSDICFQHALQDTTSFPNIPNVDDDELVKFLAVVIDKTGQPVEVRSNSDHLSCDTETRKVLQSQFPSVTQPKRMISQTGKSVEERIAEERESLNAHIWTMLNEQRRTIIAECSEKVLHHELLAAQAEQNRKTLRVVLLRQHRMKMKELQKFQNSTFDEFTQQKFIKDQKIIMELSGRLQELQNEVNFMNDSKDFMDAESVRSGNSHVTSPPGLFPRHPPFEGLLKPAFISQRQTEEPPNIRDTSGKSGNVFAHPQASSSAPYPQELNSTWRRTIEEPIHMFAAEKWKTRTRPRFEMPVRTSQRFNHLQWRRLFKELWGRPTTTADFGSSF